jgi:DNA invertase Pin-like site-specific DNA recombinase
LNLWSIRKPCLADGAKIYLRVSTNNGQTTDQRRELESVSKRSGWNLVEVFEDNGDSGAKGRDKRPAFGLLLKAVTARQIDMVAAWSIDRLGRCMQHLVGFLGELEASAATSICISKRSTPPRPAATPCSRCVACSPSSNAR